MAQPPVQQLHPWPPVSGAPITVTRCSFCLMDEAEYSTTTVDNSSHDVCQLCWQLYALTMRARRLRVGSCRRNLFMRQMEEMLDLVHRLQNRY